MVDCVRSNVNSVKVGRALSEFQQEIAGSCYLTDEEKEHVGYLLREARRWFADGAREYRAIVAREKQKDRGRKRTLTKRARRSLAKYGRLCVEYRKQFMDDVDDATTEPQLHIRSREPSPSDVD